MKKFETGTIVILKSGSPKMTVGKQMADGTIHCSWFVGTDLKSAFFYPDQLVEFDDDDN